MWQVIWEVHGYFKGQTTSNVSTTLKMNVFKEALKIETKQKAGDAFLPSQKSYVASAGHMKRFLMFAVFFSKKVW